MLWFQVVLGLGIALRQYAKTVPAVPDCKPLISHVFLTQPLTVRTISVRCAHQTHHNVAFWVVWALYCGLGGWRFRPWKVVRAAIRQQTGALEALPSNWHNACK